MPGFFRRADAVYTCRADNLPADLRQQRRVPVAFLPLLQVCFFLFQGISDFFRIGRQELRFPVGENEIVPYALRVPRCSVPYDTGSAVLQADCFTPLA